MAEWSKAADSSSVLVRGVGSNPTAGNKCGFWRWPGVRKNAFCVEMHGAKMRECRSGRWGGRDMHCAQVVQTWVHMISGADGVRSWGANSALHGKHVSIEHNELGKDACGNSPQAAAENKKRNEKLRR